MKMGKNLHYVPKIYSWILKAKKNGKMFIVKDSQKVKIFIIESLIKKFQYRLIIYRQRKIISIKKCYENIKISINE